MTKKEAVKIFGKTQQDLGDALGRTKAAISFWPEEELTRDQTRLVLGEALLQSKALPIPVLQEFSICIRIGGNDETEKRSAFIKRR